VQSKRERPAPLSIGHSPGPVSPGRFPFRFCDTQMSPFPFHNATVHEDQASDIISNVNVLGTRKEEGKRPEEWSGGKRPRLTGPGRNVRFPRRLTRGCSIRTDERTNVPAQPTKT